MARYLLDTNVLLRFTNLDDPENGIASDATNALFARGDEPVITAQVLVEFWAVATRPTTSNGLGWTVQRVADAERNLLAKFPLLVEGSQILVQWLTLVSDNDVKGKQVHDARLAAVLLSHGEQYIMTFNSSDFSRFPGVVAVHPKDVVPQNL